MRLGGRVAAAIEILEDMSARHRPASAALKDWGLSHRFAGSGDRAVIGTIVHDALRRRRSAALALGAETARAEALGAVILEWGHTPETLDAVFDGDKFAPQPLSDAERAALAACDVAAAPDAVRADIADWCAPLFCRTFGQDWVAEAAALASRPPLDIRVNTLKAETEKVLRALQGFGATLPGLAAAAIRIPPIEGAGRHPNVQAEPAFQKGWFEIQDLGSQLASLLTGAKPGEQVLDLCAGAGGKTLALSAMMDNRGQLFSHDADKQRLAPIFDRIRRAGCRNVQTAAETAELETLKGRMDLVVVDAPCTGSGTWRRHPDAKWRLGEAQMERRIEEQRVVLGQAADYVKPGGRLAYVTCSVFARENDEQIAEFLAAHPDFSTVEHDTLWAQSVPDGVGLCLMTSNGVLLTPRLTGTDGFYFSMMRRH